MREPSGNGIYERYQYPVLTHEHVPLFWRYDLNERTNPYLMERMGVSCVFNPGAIEFGGKICLVARVEGYDRKSFFAVAEYCPGCRTPGFFNAFCGISLLKKTPVYPFRSC